MRDWVWPQLWLCFPRRGDPFINIGRSPSGQEYTELMLRQNKILGNMLGAEIDFIVKGIPIHSQARSRAMMEHSTPKTSTRMTFSATEITRAWD